MANIFEINRSSNQIILGATGTTINVPPQTASRLLALDSSKNLTTKAIGIDVQAYDAGLTNLAAVEMAADKFYYTSADNTHVAATVTSFARSILDDADEATFKATVNLEIGTDVLAQQTVGIADDNLLEVDDADAADNDYAKFTVNGLEGRNYSEVKTDLSLNLVENTALSTWVGTENITTLGTIATGMWQGTSIGVTYTDAKCTATWPNTYTADQNLLEASTPTFTKLILSGASPNVLSVTATGDANPIVTITGGSNTVLTLVNSGIVAYLKFANSIEANNFIGSNGTSLKFWTENTERAAIASTGLSIGTTELTCGSINRASGTLTLEIGGTAELSITSTATTFGGNLIIPNGGTIGQAAGPLLTFDDTNDYLEVTGCAVGLGTATPSEKLHLEAIGCAVRIKNTSDTNRSAFYLVHADDDRAGFFYYDKNYTDANLAGNLSIYLDNAGKLLVSNASYMGVGLNVPTAKLHVDQSSSSGAMPVLRLDQGDIDDSFIDFIGTSAADGSRSISSDTTEDSAKFGAIRVEINGTTKWIRIYDDES
ncbi:MAG: hypothetical protein JSW07_00285 [bacterium]|nr:MAG: hypothetical protein JSW07_00285 [bacterium]